MINEYESMKFSFYKELTSFKNQLLQTSDIVPTWLHSQTDNINKSNILERLIIYLWGHVSILKNQLDRKVLNTLKDPEEISPSRTVPSLVAMEWRTGVQEKIPT